MKTLFEIIPKKFRAATFGVVLSALVRALLNFAGLAVLLPVLLMVLNSQQIHSNRVLASLYEWGGFTTDQQFIAATCAVVIGVIAIKQACNLLLQRVQRRYVVRLYKYFSVKVFRNYHDRGSNVCNVVTSFDCISISQSRFSATTTTEVATCATSLRRSIV